MAVLQSQCTRIDDLDCDIFSAVMSAILAIETLNKDDAANATKLGELGACSGTRVRVIRFARRLCFCDLSMGPNPHPQ